MAESTQAPPATAPGDAGAPATPPTPAPAADAAGSAQAGAPAPAASAAGASEAPKPAAPEKYELKLPEGSALDPARLEGIVAYAKARGLSQEAAQELLQREHEAVDSYSKGRQALYDQQRTTWAEAVKADAEIGGDTMAQNVELAKRVLTRYGSESLVKTLDDTGLGNHPELVRVFARIGKQMSEDQLVLPGAGSNGPKDDRELFYGKPN